MKRSEMLEMIQNVIEHYHSDSDLSIQECVLQMIEREGMSPPKYTERLPANSRQLSFGIWETLDVCMVREVIGWEPED